MSTYSPCKPTPLAITFALSMADNTSQKNKNNHGIGKLDKRKLHRRRTDTTGHPSCRHTASAGGQDRKPDHGAAPTIRAHCQPKQAHSGQGKKLYGTASQLDSQLFGQGRVRCRLYGSPTRREPRATIGKPLATTRGHQNPIGS